MKDFMRLCVSSMLSPFDASFLFVKTKHQKFITISFTKKLDKESNVEKLRCQ